MKRTLVIEEIIKTEHKFVIEIDDNVGIDEEIYNDDDIAFDEVLNVIKESDDVEDCKEDILRVHGVIDIQHEEGVWITEKLGFVREE